jgi:hypothetical protein
MILAIGAHPDEVEFGYGGTLRRFVKNGQQVAIWILTDGNRVRGSDCPSSGAVHCCKDFGCPYHHELSIAGNGSSKICGECALFRLSFNAEIRSSFLGNIESTFDIKMKALLSHVSQCRKVLSGLTLIDVANATARFRGIPADTVAAEAFLSRTVLIQNASRIVGFSCSV